MELEERHVKYTKDRKPGVETFSLAFRDVEDPLRKFNGSDGYPVKKWIEEFE